MYILQRSSRVFGVVYAKVFGDLIGVTIDRGQATRFNWKEAADVLVYLNEYRDHRINRPYKLVEVK